MNKHYKIVRQVTITGYSGEYVEALNWCAKNGYEVRNSWSPRIGDTYRLDLSKFGMKAEKAIKE